MNNPLRVSGDRSHLSPVYGKYAPDAARVTETTEIVEELNTVLAGGERVVKRTEKVYGLWQRAGDRHEEKGEDAIAAARVVADQQRAIARKNQVWAFLAGVAATVTVTVSMWAVFG